MTVAEEPRGLDLCVTQARTARGFRNRDNFKTAIYFHCGGFDLVPKPT